MSARPPQGTPAPRVPLTTEKVLRAAIAVADERGVSAVTMRAVAMRLGVEAMSLYNHVTNKDAMLDGMVDLVVEEIDLPTHTDDWRDAMRGRAVSAHQAFSRHAWAPALLDSRQTSGPARLRYFDWVLGTLVAAGFSLADAARCFSVLDSYIYGFGIQQLSLTSGEASPEQAAESMLSAVPAADYPQLHRMVRLAMDLGYDAEADFAFGLEVVLAGLGQVLTAVEDPSAAAGRSRSVTGSRSRPDRRSVEVTEPSRLPTQGAMMGDKSPRQSMTKKSGKSIKEKRADKRGQAGAAHDAAVIAAVKKR